MKNYLWSLYSLTVSIFRVKVMTSGNRGRQPTIVDRDDGLKKVRHILLLMSACLVNLEYAVFFT